MTARPRRPATSTIRLALALLLCAVAVRPLAVSFGPLLPAIQEDLAMGPLAAGLVGMVPVLCLGLFAPLGVRLTRSLPPETALAWALGITIAFGVARAAAPDAAWLVILTIGLGVGMGLAGPIPSMLIKARAPDRPATMTGAHGAGVVGGSVLGAVLIVPLALLADGWRGATLLITIPIAVATAVGLALLGRASRPIERPRPSVIPWRDPTAWLLAAIFGLQSFVYWGLVIWLAAVLTADGWTPAAAGGVVAIYQLSSFLGVITVGIVADRWGTRRQQLLLSSTAVTAALVAVLLAPLLTIAWIALAGFALGAALPLALTLPVDHGRDERDAGGKAGLMLLVGYLVAAGGPVVIGAIREGTSASAPVYVALVIAGAVFILAASHIRSPASDQMGSPR